MISPCLLNGDRELKAAFNVVCPVPPCATVTVVFDVKIVASAFGSVNVFSAEVGPVNFAKPLPVPP